MLETFLYARKRYGVTSFVIDNLQKCGIKMTDDDEVKDFVDQLTDFAKTYDVTVFLIHHMRKGENESNQGKMGIKGSGAITDMVDTILVWWRNKKKENDKYNALGAGEYFDESEQPDAVLYCEGQRNGESEPKISLWFHRQSMQFLEMYGQKPYVYFDYIDNKQEKQSQLKDAANYEHY